MKLSSSKIISRALFALVAGLMMSAPSLASDHDDGEIDAKGRALNLTDFYVFREDKEVAGGSAAHLVMLMNLNPRALPRQQYHFSTNAYYDIHVSRAGASKDVAATTADNVIFRLKFAAPDSSGQQAITVTVIKDGSSASTSSKDGGGSILTTPLTLASAEVTSDVTLAGGTFKVFAGLRKDPFFFDVTSFFKFRIAAAGNYAANANTIVFPITGFTGFTAGPPFVYTPDGETASDFTGNYNVNTIGLRVPIAMLQSSGTDKVFDMWTTISNLQ